jgi:hypothetical protein
VDGCIIVNWQWACIYQVASTSGLQISAELHAPRECAVDNEETVPFVAPLIIL